VLFPQERDFLNIESHLDDTQKTIDHKSNLHLMQATHVISTFLKRDEQNHKDVSLIKVYLLRFVFGLTFLFVGYDAWKEIITHKSNWLPLDAVAFCVWASYATLSILGVFYPLRMLPLVMFQISYKTIWLVIVAFPLWSTNQLEGSTAEGMTNAFLWVALPIVAMPWKHFFNHFVLGRQ
jgi:hypothetical protein